MKILLYLFLLFVGAIVGLFTACLSTAAALNERGLRFKNEDEPQETGIPDRIEYRDNLETYAYNFYVLGWNDYRNRLLGLPEEDTSNFDWYGKGLGYERYTDLQGRKP